MTSAALDTDLAHPPAAPGQWQAFHVFYHASRHAMISTCVKPLADELRRDGLVDGFFFINYWLEGPHLRLRLKPSSAAAADEVTARAQAAIAGFLRSRPALYEAQVSHLADFYNAQFTQELSEEERARYVGPDGRMLIRANNSFSREAYEPEYGKYGGVAGVALAEWHFEHSSDLVGDIVRTMNVHRRTSLLGIAAQLMMVLCAEFLPDRAGAIEYLGSYHEFWRGSFDSAELLTSGRLEDGYAKAGPGMRERFAAVRRAQESGATDLLPEFLRVWAEHCAQLRVRVIALAESGDLAFQTWDGPGEERVADPSAALQRLLLPYLHMTNNRLGMTLLDEAYLAWMLAEASREVAP